MASAEPLPVTVDQPTATDTPAPDPAWDFPQSATSIPTLVQRGKEVRYFIVPLGGQRVLIVSQNHGFGHGNKEKRAKHHRHGWD